MFKYFFILGRNPTLSIAEIAAVLEQLKLTFSFISLSSEILLVDIQETINAKQLTARLGGTIKLGLIFPPNAPLQKHANKDANFCELNANEFANMMNMILENLPRDKKIYFGFSFYKLDEEIKDSKFKKKCQKIKNLAMPVKKLLKEIKIHARWVISKELNLSSVVVKKNKLLAEAGAEIVFLIGEEKIYLGKTLAVQDFEELSFRDFGRPARDMRVGLMPPKLAKIMINLARVDKDATILDPFCGFATILGEATLADYKNLIGADINDATLDGAKQNLEWLKKNYRLPIANYQLLECDARHLSKKFSPQSVDAIITEPSLGPPLRGNESPKKISQIIKELSDLYLAAFCEFKKILKPAGKIVILFPVFRAQSPSPSTGEGWGEGGVLPFPKGVARSAEGFLPILNDIKKIGFSPISPLPKELQKYNFLQITPRQSIIYSRPEQKVMREIFIFTRC